MVYKHSTNMRGGTTLYIVIMEWLAPECNEIDLYNCAAASSGCEMCPHVYWEPWWNAAFFKTPLL